ncbi:geranylgeranylglycerol-phosphate geranylgeranyltransferase [uncultured Polaribacter sp.]|uniref:geranylgeranylglycerol-phosphate geranylgeranyltransferase n=1 Tax=uncultured Polaribacter sp. TaxID=174711 RepID=UPI0026241024|nr:geranylgeranylglycerol-phosphate geranylgeranyltransferase [uncultured Polaribacter sp.]
MVLLTMVLTKYALLHSFIQHSYVSNLEFGILIASVLSITAGGYIVNDIFDLETDKINKPDKIFIASSISEKNAWRSYFLLTSTGLFLGVYLSIIKTLPFFSFIFVFSSLGLFFYSKFFKKKVLLGNLLISLFIGLTIYIVYLFCFKYHEFTLKEQLNSMLFLQVWLAVISYTLFAFLITFIREIIKDIEDIHGDLKIQAKTLAILVGRKRAAKFAFFFSCILLFFLLMMLQSLKNEVLFLSYGIVFILIPLIYFMHQLWSSESKKDFSKLSKILKIIMLFGILSMLLFKV